MHPALAPQLFTYVKDHTNLGDQPIVTVSPGHQYKLGEKKPNLCGADSAPNSHHLNLI